MTLIRLQRLNVFFSFDRHLESFRERSTRHTGTDWYRREKSLVLLADVQTAKCMHEGKRRRRRKKKVISFIIAIVLFGHNKQVFKTNFRLRQTKKCVDPASSSSSPSPPFSFPLYIVHRPNTFEEFNQLFSSAALAKIYKIKKIITNCYFPAAVIFNVFDAFFVFSQQRITAK